MKKLMLLTFALLLVFSGSVIASSDGNQVVTANLGQSSSFSGNIIQQLQITPSNGDEGLIGSGCWYCTSYVYINGAKVCVSSIWRTTCPIYG